MIRKWKSCTPINQNTAWTGLLRRGGLPFIFYFKWSLLLRAVCNIFQIQLKEQRTTFSSLSVSLLATSSVSLTEIFRYPTFGSAIRDLDDALCLCFVFATLPHTRILKEGLIDNCRRLTSEFMHYVIEAHALKNTFISIKVSVIMQGNKQEAKLYQSSLLPSC